jgi:cytochrome P450
LIGRCRSCGAVVTRIERTLVMSTTMRDHTMGELAFDPISLGIRDDLYPAYRRLREEAPVYYNAQHDFWALSRYGDVMAADNDWATFTGKYGLDLDDTSNQFGEGFPPLGLFLGYDPPRHTDMRKALQGTFLPRGLKALEPMVREKCDTLVANFIGKGNADLIAAFAAPFPDTVMAEVLGFPREQHPGLSQLLRTALQRDLTNLPPPYIPAESVRAGEQLKNALKEVVGARRRLDLRDDPSRDDLIGKLLAAEVEGESLPEEEIVGTVFFLFTAGTEEVSGVIGNALLLLAQHPDQRARLVENPDEIPAAVEEILRFETIVQHHVRTTTTEVELHGQTILEGARVLLLWGSANRDDREFPDPDRFDIARRPRNLASFGGGVRRCLGAPLARLEARIALEALLPQMPDYSLAGSHEWSQRVNFRGLRKLPLSWTPRAQAHTRSGFG